MNHLWRLIPVSEQSTLHIWQPWAREKASLRSQDIGGAVCSLPASRWCCCLLADPLVCPRSGRVCEGNGVKSQEPTMEKEATNMVFTSFLILLWDLCSYSSLSPNQKGLVSERTDNCLKGCTDLLIWFFLLNFNKKCQSPASQLHKGKDRCLVSDQNEIWWRVFDNCIKI